MKKQFYILPLFCLLSFVAIADKPSLMVLPDNTWMTVNGFVIDEVLQGENVKTMDYVAAFSSNEQLANITAAIEEVFSDRQFPLVNYMAQEDYRYEDNVEKDMMDVEDNNIDAVVGNRKRDLAHIRLEIGWTEEADRSITLRLTAKDAFSNKSVAAKTYDGFQVSRLTPIRRAIKLGLDSKIDGFVDQILEYFKDIQDNGRECQLTIFIDQGTNVDFDSEFEEGTLGEIIADWLDENTKNGQYSERNATRTRLTYDQVRVPLKDERGRQQNMRSFTSGLSKHLRTKYKVKSHISSSEPGSARLIIDGQK